MHTPPRVHRGTHSESPPATPRPGQLRRELRRNPARAAELLDADSTLVHTAFREHGYEPIVVGVVRDGSPVQSLALLLQRRAVVDEVDTHGLTALQLVAKAPQFLENRLIQQGSASLVTGSVNSPAHLGAVAVATQPGRSRSGAGGQHVTALEEDLCCSYAACLLAFGADASRRDAAGRCPAELAMQQGKELLAGVIRHWTELQYMRWLRRAKRRALERLAAGRSSLQAAELAAPPLLLMPDTAFDVLCSCLIPHAIEAIPLAWIVGWRVELNANQ